MAREWLLGLVVTLLGCADGGSSAADAGHAPDAAGPGRINVRACLVDPGCQTRMISAHRGLRTRAPENTLAAYRDAVEAGADVLETDIRATADGELVLMHDDTVDRTTDGTGEVASMTWAQIQALTVHNHDDPSAEQDPRPEAHKVPRLRDLIALCRELGCQVDYDWKTGTAEQLLGVIRAENGVELGFVHKRDAQSLVPLRQMEPGLLLMPNVATAADVDAAIALLDVKIVEAEVDLGGTVATEAVSRARELGIKAYADALGLPDVGLANGDDTLWYALVQSGLHIIASDVTDRAYGYLVQQGYRSPR
ncbi:MAG: glycerophosphodiester phosphodiesterase family protein [Myxococcota bacterium]